MLCRWDTVITNQITSACPHEGEGHICAGNGVPMWASELWNVMTETWEMPVLTRITSNEQLGKISSSLKTALVESQLAVFVDAQAMPLNAPNIFLNYDALKKVKFLMGKDWILFRPDSSVNLPLWAVGIWSVTWAHQQHRLVHCFRLLPQHESCYR